MLISAMSANPGIVKKVLKLDSLEEIAEASLQTDWSPGIFEGNKRSVSTWKQTELLVLDVDSGCTLEQAKQEFGGYARAVLTSRNHGKEKNGVTADRFRVILKLTDPIKTKEEYEATWNWAKNKWPFIDEACKDVSRMYYASKELISVVEDGGYVDIATPTPKPVIEAIRPLKSEVKGLLSRKTLEFLANGAPAGSRHSALVAATGDMRDQGYDLNEILIKVEAMSETSDWTQTGLSQKDIQTITDVFNREPKYALREDPRSAEQTLTETPLDLLDETLDYLADKEKVKGDSTGIDGLDKLLGGGFRTGELTVLMANAKSGKNSLYHYMLYTMMQRGLAIAYASRELSPASEVIPNLLSIATGNNAWEQEVDAGYRELTRQIVSQWPLKFASGYGYFPPDQLVAWLKEMKESGVNHFLIDHLHYMLKGEDYESTAELIKILKTQTKELDIHINLIVQPRSLREGEKLSLSTLRGGAAIGQALDNLLILERVRGEANISKLTLEVARHKLARPGNIYLQYDSNSTTFQEVDRVTVAPEPEGLEGYRRGGGRSWPRSEH